MLYQAQSYTSLATSECVFCVIVSPRSTASLCKLAAPLARHNGIYSFCLPISIIRFEVASSPCTFTPLVRTDKMIPWVEWVVENTQWKVACWSFKCILKAFDSRKFWSDQPSQCINVSMGLFFLQNSVVEYPARRCSNIKDFKGLTCIVTAWCIILEERHSEFECFENFSLLYFVHITFIFFHVRCGCTRTIRMKCMVNR